ncbi:MAG: phosphomannomutase/phosphoglucomutase [Pisciglobus halotolerans]|nr:phosphomannomutase/phosphoglucomutase [Pisciglobus halotolerans]
MEQKAMLELQSGSDIRGIATQTNDTTITLTDEAIEAIAYGFVVWLKNKKQVISTNDSSASITIGQDSRISGNHIKAILIETLRQLGITVFDVGLATTPAIFMSTQYEEYQADAGIMITASHLPFQYNGLKFFTKDGGAEHEDIAYILQHAEQSKVDWPINQQGDMFKKQLLQDYASDLEEKIRKGIRNAKDSYYPLKGTHIIVDAGNGAGGFFVADVLEKLGANTTGSQFLEPDGNFPNHIPNPDNKAAMKSLQDAVNKENADMGIIFDTDVDRAALVDKNGNPLNRNNLIAVISAILIKENPGTTIVTNSTTSDHLKTFIEQLGGCQDRYLTGYRNVINRAVELNRKGTSVSLAIETSGHAALRENYFLDDGAYLIAKILIADAEMRKEGKDFSDLIASLKQPAETDEVRFAILTDTVQQTGEEVMAAFKKFAESTRGFSVERNNLEGVRVNLTEQYGSGFMLLRLSLHEPLLVLNMENDQSGSILQLKDTLKTFFYSQKELDSSRL